MKRAYKSKVVHIATNLTALFIPLSIFVPPLELYILIGSVLFTCSFAVVWAYWPSLKTAIKSSVRQLTKVDVLTMGIVLIFLATGLREAYVTIWRVAFPLYVTRADEYFIPLAFCRYLALVAALLCLCSRKVTKKPGVLGHIPGWPYTISSVGLGIAIAVTLITLRVTS